MYETREKYQAILEREIPTLEGGVGHQVRHLDDGECPRCGREGKYDLDGLGFSPGAGNSIYYSTVYFEWRCRACDFRMCS